ncbi:MAG: hypothetical protein ASARMPREDX12_003640 [Alectoria sarmentosa]|nr:MAG: hypothetical protein ASARMPREDX12_003640 [Alectoria sarmentosa]
MSKYEYNKSEVQGAKIPPHLTVTRQDHDQDQDQDHLTSPEPHPKPSPHISGLTAPNNTPKTATSSPRLAASNTHNEDVSEAFSAYVNSMDGRPLSDSIWAPGSARYKPSVLSGYRSTRLLTPIKTVELIPSINDTFDRMSFKAADPDYRVDENLIGDRVTHSIFSKAPPSFVNKFSVLADRLHGDEVDNVQAKSKAESDEHFESSAHADLIKNVQFKTNGAVKEDSKIALCTDKSEEVQAKGDRKGIDVPSTSTAYVPPHLRGSGTQAPVPKLKHSDEMFPAAMRFIPSKSSQTPSDSDQNPTSSEFAVKTETNPPYPKEISSNVTSKVADPDPVKDANSAFITSLIGQLQERGPLAPEHLSVLISIEGQLRAKASYADAMDSQAVTRLEPEPKRTFFESSPLQLARQMSYGSTKPAPSALPRLTETKIRVATNGAETKVTTGPLGAKAFKDYASESEDIEHKTFFNAWPKLEGRSRPAAAKTRKVIIKDLPRGSTNTFVASLVYGGPIEEIRIRSSPAGDLSAAIRFMDAGDCTKYYHETSNGLVCKKDAKGGELVLFVELSKDVDVVGGMLQGWIDSGVTRCVRAVGVEAEWGMDGLVKVAERKNRKVEKIVDGQNAGGARSVVFRFCKVEDAVQFKAALSRDEEWEHCNIHYAADPCATATEVQLEG